MRQKLGQHFLRDQAIIARIIATADIQADDGVIEIGPGQGVLTRLLAHRAQACLALEYDPQLAAALQADFADQPHVRILHADARQIDYREVLTDFPTPARRLKVVANLPYYAAVPIMLTIFQHAALFSSCTLMFQKEVAERITAQSGSKAYGTLSVTAQYYSAPQYCFTVPAGAFCPPPQVASAVIQLQFWDAPRLTVTHREHFFQLVKDAFLTRRKMLKNALRQHHPDLFPAERLAQAFEALHFSAHVRGEELTPQDFAALSNFFMQDTKRDQAGLTS